MFSLPQTPTYTQTLEMLVQCFNYEITIFCFIKGVEICGKKQICNVFAIEAWLSQLSSLNSTLTSALTMPDQKILTFHIKSIFIELLKTLNFISQIQT